MIPIEKVVGKAINGLSFIAPDTTGKLTLELFCRPQKGKIFTEKEQAFLDQAEWIDLRLEGKKIQCYKWGNGEKKVLLAHGFNSNASRWRPLANLLQKDGYQVVAFDIPAHGNSDWKRVNGLLYAQVVAQVIPYFKPDFIVGHSFAGIAFTYYFSQMEAQPVDKMVLMGVPNKLMDITQVFFQQLGLGKRVQDAYSKVFRSKFNYPIDYFTLSNFLKEIDILGLVIHDENDEIVPYEGAIEMHEAWTNSTFFSTKKLGHSLQGSSVFKEILRFLK